jgi:hypothetical protein
MLSDGRGAERSDPLAAVRDVTEGGENFTIATALFVPQNEEVEMERSLLLRGVTVWGCGPLVPSVCIQDVPSKGQHPAPVGCRLHGKIHGGAITLSDQI